MLSEYYQGLVICIDINGEKPQVHEIVLPKGLSLHILHMADEQF
jgi:hypothetical protein